MRDPGDECPECGAIPTPSGCKVCGWKRPGEAPTAYREAPERVWQDSQPDDPCSEPGCDKRVRDHMREFQEYGRRIHGRVVKL